MPRSIPAVVRRELEAPQTALFLLVLAEITHPDLLEPARVANDVVSYSLGGNLYVGIPFEIELLSDGDRPPRGRLGVSNVDQRIAEVVLALSSPPRVKLEIYDGSDFAAPDASRVRAAIGTPTPFYSARHLRLKNISGNVASISGELTSWDPGRETWPSIRATRDRLPGLFR